jgi:hypothetical protein
VECSLECINESWHDWFASEEDRAIAVFNIIVPNRIIRIGYLELPVFKKRIEYQISITLKESEHLRGLGLKIKVKPLEKARKKFSIDISEINHEFDVTVNSSDTLTINGDIQFDESIGLKGGLNG